MTISDIVFTWCVRNRLFFDRDRFNEFVTEPLSRGSIADAALAIKNHGSITDMRLDDIERELSRYTQSKSVSDNPCAE